MEKKINLLILYGCVEAVGKLRWAVTPTPLNHLWLGYVGSIPITPTKIKMNMKRITLSGKTG